MIEVLENAIDVERALAHVRSPEAGAVVLFLGTARQFTRGRETQSLDYECYAAMAVAQLQELESQAAGRWDLTKVYIRHRIGHLELGEACVVIAVSAPHRHAAFEAGAWLIDTIKQVVPIWKCENWADGTREWVHPGAETPEPS